MANMIKALDTYLRRKVIKEPRPTSLDDDIARTVHAAGTSIGCNADDGSAWAASADGAGCCAVTARQWYWKVDKGAVCVVLGYVGVAQEFCLWRNFRSCS